MLVVDNAVQTIAPGGAASFSGSVTFDDDSPFGAEPMFSPLVPGGFLFAPALGLAGPFPSGDVYSGPLFSIQAPGDATGQVYSGRGYGGRKQ